MGHCQQADSTNTPVSDSIKTFPKVDVFDVASDIVGRRIGNKDSANSKPLSFLPSLNYAPHTSWAAGGILNGAFNIGSSESTNLSVVTLVGIVTLNKQILLSLKSNIWSNKKLLNFVGDWRYLKYPSFTYGLGSNTEKENKELIEYSYLRFYQLVYRKLIGDYYLGGGYNVDYHYNITEGPAPTLSDFDLYGPSKTSVSSGLVLSALYDTRNNLNNPIAGSHYANVSYRNNFKAIGSDNNWQQLLVDARKYVEFPKNSHNILAFWSYNWFTLGNNVPYLDLPSSAWDTYDNQGRGYIQGRFRSNDLMAFETEYRFNVTKNRLLGGVVFSNVQTINNWYTKKFDKLYPAAGVGVRIKVNKHTNTNISIDYSVGIKGESGFFFNLGEVF